MTDKRLPYHCTNGNCTTYGDSVNVPVDVVEAPCSNCLRPMRREYMVPKYVTAAAARLRAPSKRNNFRCVGEVIVEARDLEALLKFVDRNMPDFADKTPPSAASS